MEKNNRGLLITLIALLSVIALLLSGIFAFALISGTRSLSSFIPMKNQTVFDQTYSAEEIKSIIIESSAGDITVKSSNDGKIRLTANGISSEQFSAESDNGTLSILSKELKGKYKFFLFGALKEGTDIVLYIPQNLESLNIALNFGDVDIDAYIVTDLTIDNNMGNIDAKQLGGSFNIHTDMGNIDIEKIDITAYSEVTTNMGDIDIERTNAVNIYAKTSMGSCDVKDNTPNAPVTLTAQTDMGNIDIND